ncbi:hypothetical protein C8R43DRAFT_877626 [Mycena crocata]|nr:hypothetical protein C8R43DRAFT_877626 [Mycena crocata]
MHYPLTIYWMLCHSLQVTSVEADFKERVHLTVHYIGAEIELNAIPLLSELALLLPQHDIDIVLFGPCVFNIGREGLTSAHKSSLIERTARDNTIPIFTYKAPEACGSGSVRVFLHTKANHWTKRDLPTYGRRPDYPDALIACNAGLFTYDAMEGVVRASFECRIPFVVTDYKQYMLESNSDTISQMSRVAYPRLHTPPQPVEMNPFHRPGQRFIFRADLAPDMDNGFILVVYNRAD